MMGGGVLIVLGSILRWRDFSLGFGSGGISGLNFDNMGLFGIIALLIGLGLTAIGAIRAFNVSVNLPDSIAGFSLDQLGLIEAFTVFLWSFALISANFIGIGVHLTWIGAALATAGAVLSLREQPATTTAI